MYNLIVSFFQKKKNYLLKITYLVIECCKLKIGPSLPCSLLEMTVWRKNELGSKKDYQK